MLMVVKNVTRVTERRQLLRWGANKSQDAMHAWVRLFCHTNMPALGLCPLLLSERMQSSAQRALPVASIQFLPSKLYL